MTVFQDAVDATVEAGSQTPLPTGDPVFAFRLHQFLASGGSIYATFEPAERRRFRADAQYRLPAGGRDAGEEALLYPLAFCRDSGRSDHGGATVRAEPRSPRLNAPLDEMAGEPGYLTIEDGGLWDEQEELPDGWLDWRGREPKLKANYAEHVPQKVWVRSDGELSLVRVDGAIQGWWQPRPLMLCPRCRVSFDTRQTSDFGKLVTLSQTGRSTATTVIATATVAALREDPSVEREARKLLSFTDNRQDAALQAGHLNGFVQVVLLRGSLVRALEHRGGLSFDILGRAIFDAMEPPPEQFMREPVDHGPGFDRACGAMIALLDYLALEDLARAWRVAQPNLGQCGLLRIEYDGLDRLAADDRLWQGVPMLGEAPVEDRTRVLRALLDHLRGALALDAPSLEDEPLDSLRRRVAGELREPWRFDEREQLRRPALALLPGIPASRRGRIPTLGLGSRSPSGGTSGRAAPGVWSATLPPTSRSRSSSESSTGSADIF